MRTAISRRGRTAASGALQARGFHFGSPAYNAAFLPAVEVDPGPIRSAALLAIAAQRSRPRQWFDEPVTSLLRGTTLTGGTRVETIDAFGRANGAQLLASEAEMQTIIEHAELFVGTPRDLRSAVRRAEASMLGEHAGALVANQALDFGKQDGVTEIEEAHQANAVEQRLNDLVWQSEQAGQLQIPRRVVLVPCVSNFSHFLDMCRKVCRNLELGVPVIVLSRSHTAQYPFRWAQLLQAELQVSGRPGKKRPRAGPGSHPARARTGPCREARQTALPCGRVPGSGLQSLPPDCAPRHLLPPFTTPPCHSGARPTPPHTCSSGAGLGPLPLHLLLSRPRRTTTAAARRHRRCRRRPCFRRRATHPVPVYGVAWSGSRHQGRGCTRHDCVNAGTPTQNDGQGGWEEWSLWGAVVRGGWLRERLSNSGQ